MRCLLVLALSFTAIPSFAGPQGGTVVDGTAAISTVGKVTTINQSTDRAIVNWQKFESTATETIRFNQPGTMSLTLNRVVGVDPSFLGGALQANGRLFIINPNGIVFGPNSQVNVGSLVASSLSITDDDFKNNRFIFLQNPDLELSSVINRGSITAGTGGTVALLAPIVDNSGTIVAAAGRVILRGAISASIDIDNPNVGPGFDTAGRNVRMAESGLTPVLEDVVNTTSIAPANRVQRLGDGTVFLRGAAGTVVNSGNISVDATGGTAAGNVDVQGEFVAALGAGSRISALSPGAPGTGSVSVGGNFGKVYYTRGGTGSTARAVLEAGGAVNIGSVNESIESDASGSLEARARTVNLSAARAVGRQSTPIRVNAERLQAFSEGEVGIVSDGSLTLDFIGALSPGVTISTPGSLFAGTGRTAGFGFNVDPGPLHIASVFSNVRLNVGGSVGTPAAPLKVFGSTTANVAGDTNITPTVPTSVSLPGTPSTVNLDDTAPVARTAYSPPTDPADIPVTGIVPGAGGGGGGGVGDGGGVITVTGGSSSGSSSGATIGGRDNVLLSANRGSLVKTDDSAGTSGGDSNGDVVVVRNSDSAGPDDPSSVADAGDQNGEDDERDGKKAPRVARAGNGRTGGTANAR